MGINPLLSKHIKTLEEKDMLTSILEKNKVALIHGESGSGKTVFAIKHLNDNKITYKIKFILRANWVLYLVVPGKDLTKYSTELKNGGGF